MEVVNSQQLHSYEEMLETVNSWHTLRNVGSSNSSNSTTLTRRKIEYFLIENIFKRKKTKERKALQHIETLLLC